MTLRTANTSRLTSILMCLQPPRAGRHRQGLSLLELLLVITVLSALFAISWPALRRPLNRSYIQGAAQQLQRDLQNARLTAMETGHRQIFQFRWETVSYRIGNEVVQDELSSQPRSSDKTPGIDSSSISSTGFAEYQSNSEYELPIGTKFVTKDVESPTATRLGRSDSEDELGLNESSSRSSRQHGSRSASNREAKSKTPPRMKPGNWSSPIRFYPSGRMESATLHLQSEDGYRINIQIQGLAGRIKITDLHRTDSSEPTDGEAEK